MSTTTTPAKGLEGVVAATSSICYIDGERGILAYRGIDIHDLAQYSTFEETCFLLWNGRLPKAQELEQCRKDLAAERKLDANVISFLRQFPKDASPMEVLRTTVSPLSFYDPDDKHNDHDANVRKSRRLPSQIAMILPGFDRIPKPNHLFPPAPPLSPPSI